MDDVNSLAQKAIEEALASNWEGAIAKNQEILLRNPSDLEAKNRLAKAYLESGKIAAAKQIYQEVLEIDPYNQIALKNLKRVEGFNGEEKNNKNTFHQLNSAVFLSEPGKTKLVNLVHLAAPQILSSLSPGEQLALQAKKHTVYVLNQNGQYLGALPDDISHLLISLMAGGNTYEIYVKKASSNCLQVIIWEKHRSKNFINQPSFLPNGKINYYPFFKEETRDYEQNTDNECDEDFIEKEENWNL